MMELYNRLRVIGKGSYGEVWLVRHKKDKKQYVLKRMNLCNASEKERKAAELEAKLLSKLKHPNIVSYKDSFETGDGYIYIVMGYCEGGDLYTKLKQQKGEPLEEKQIVEWFVQIAMALQYMHERNILHRDLKTQNIFLTRSKIIKVGDLGIARVLDSASDMATTLIGTPYYMSPELFSNKPYNHKSDVWALGCCVYEMATLKHAFNARDMNSLMYKVLKGTLPSMPEHYSLELTDLMRQMLNQNPDRRPSVNKILRNPFIKKYIAVFLENARKSRPSSGGSSGGSRPNSAGSESWGGGGGGSNNRTSTSEMSTNGSVSTTDLTLQDMESDELPVINPAAASRRRQLTPIMEVSVTGSAIVTGPVAKEKPAPVIEEVAVVKAEEKGEGKKEKKKKKKVSPKKQKSSVGEIKHSSSTSALPDAHRQQQHQHVQPLITKSDHDLSSQPITKVSSAPYFPPIGAQHQQHHPHTSKSLSDINASVSSTSSSNSSSSTTSSNYELHSPNMPMRPPNTSARARRRQKLEEQRCTDAAPNPSPKSQDGSGVVLPALALASGDKQGGSSSSKEKHRAKTDLTVVEEDNGNSQHHKKHKTNNGSSEPKNSAASGKEKKKSEGQKDMDNFITLLDSTLHLQQQQQQQQQQPLPEGNGSTDYEDEFSLGGLEGKSKSNHVNGVREERERVQDILQQNNMQLKLQGADKSLGTSGRLNDRMQALRRDCQHGLGSDLLHQAYILLERYDGATLQENLINLLGEENYELYGGKIWQLKFCEDSILRLN